MNRERFISLVKNPGLLKAEDTPFLEELIKEFPFFQTAHLLTARCYKVTDSIHLQKQIKNAAAHITDRRVLYNLIENFSATEKTVEHDEKTIVELNSEVIPSQKSFENEISKELTIKENPEIVETAIELNSEANNVTTHQIEALIQPETIATPQIIDEVIDTTIEENKSLDNKTEDLPIESVDYTGEISVIEAEIPLEREIKLALAESVYLKELEEIKQENTQVESKNEAVSLEIEQNAEQIIAENALPEQNVKVEDIEPAPTDFVSWLKKLKVEAKTAAETTVKNEENKEEKLIDAFMEKPIQRPKPIKQEFYSPVNMAKQSVTDNDFFVTETLAKIYIKQGNFAKAIKVYQNLSLKNPEKNTFFAAQIKILKEQLHNKSGK